MRLREFMLIVLRNIWNQEKRLTALSDKLDGLDALLTKTGTDLATAIADLKSALPTDVADKDDVAAALARMDGITAKVNAIDLAGIAADPGAPAAPAPAPVDPSAPTS